MKITAVILHYWLERTDNIKVIVDALKKGSVRPDKIIVFNNNLEGKCPKIKGVSMIDSSVNYGGRARYPIALLEPSDYYFFIDDDTCPQSKTLENFLQHATRGCCLGYLGKKTTSSYTDGKNYWGDKVNKPKKVDLLVGHGSMFVSFEALLKGFLTDRKLLDKDYGFGREEDIVLSMSNDSLVIPAGKDEYLTRLPDDGGYCRVSSHNDLRNKMVERLKQ